MLQFVQNNGSCMDERPSPWQGTWNCIQTKGNTTFKLSAVRLI